MYNATEDVHVMRRSKILTLIQPQVTNKTRFMFSFIKSCIVYFVEVFVECYYFVV